MRVNGYVEWFNESNTYGEWERCAEFKYSDDAIAFARDQYAKRTGPYSFRAVRCHTDDGSNGIVWHSDGESRARWSARQDKIAISYWINGKASLEEVLDSSNIGLVGKGNVRFTQRARRKFHYLWMWSAPRFSGPAAGLQDALYERGGMPALKRRMNRVNALIRAYGSN